MTRWRLLNAIGVVAMMVVGIGALTPAPALADDTCQTMVLDECVGDHAGNYKVDLDNQAVENVVYCLKTSTSGVVRTCKELMVRKTATLYIPFKPGERVLLDFEVKVGLGTSTWNDNDITGGHQCTSTGVTIGTKVDCHIPKSDAGQSFSLAPMPPYSMDHAGAASDPGGNPGMSLLNLLAWCVSAAAVAGFMITGMNMGLQLRRGEPGEFSEHWRGFIMVGTACILGASAGPIVQFLHIV